MSKKVIEAEVKVISSKKSTKAKQSKPAPKKPSKNQQTDNPFAAFGAGGANGMPDLSKLPNLPLKPRIMFKLMSLLGNPKLRFLKSKWSIPIWGLIAVVVLGLILTVGVTLLIFKLLKVLLSPYARLFQKK